MFFKKTYIRYAAKLRSENDVML